MLVIFICFITKIFDFLLKIVNFESMIYQVTVSDFCDGVFSLTVAGLKEKREKMSLQDFI